MDQPRKFSRATKEYLIEHCEFDSMQALTAFVNAWAAQGYTLKSLDMYADDNEWLVIMERDREA